MSHQMKKIVSLTKAPIPQIIISNVSQDPLTPPPTPGTSEGPSINGIIMSPYEYSSSLAGGIRNIDLIEQMCSNHVQFQMRTPN